VCKLLLWQISVVNLEFKVISLLNIVRVIIIILFVILGVAYLTILKLEGIKVFVY